MEEFKNENLVLMQRDFRVFDGHINHEPAAFDFDAQFDSAETAAYQTRDLAAAMKYAKGRPDGVTLIRAQYWLDHKRNPIAVKVGNGVYGGAEIAAADAGIRKLIVEAINKESGFAK